MASRLQSVETTRRQLFSDLAHEIRTPVAVLDTPSSAVFTSEASIATYSGQDLSIAVQGDLQHTAAHTWASVRSFIDLVVPFSSAG